MVGPDDPLNIVLHQIRSPENLGAVARLMANFGFGRMILSDPRTFGFPEAHKTAVHATHILEGMRITRRLGQALAESTYVLGTTSRNPVKGRQVLTPDEALTRLAEASRRGPVALVFGGEQRGLSDEDLSICHDILVVPTRAEQPSINLAQSAAILLYLAREKLSTPPRMYQVEASQPEQGAESGSEEGARMQILQALEDRMERVLLQAGFLNPQAPERVLRELLRALFRARLSQREAELWLTAFKQVERVIPKPAA